MKNFYLIWGVIMVLVVGGLIFLLARSADENADGTLTTQTLTVPVSSADWSRGPSNAKVTLLEYADFQCPGCAAYAPIVEQLYADYSDRVRFIYRHFPLPQHKQAELAAYASEAAGLQGKFWEMALKIYQNQRDWADKGSARETFLSYARDLALDMTKFEADLSNIDIAKKVDDQKNSGVSSTVNSTPTFFLNLPDDVQAGGRKIKNPASYNEFKQVIEQALSGA